MPPQNPHRSSDTADAAHATRQRRLLWVLGLLSMVAGYALTYVIPTDDWPTWRRVGAGLVMGLWCAFLVVLTRASGAFK